MVDHDSPTLLVFTLGPGREQARKRWLTGRFEGLGREVHNRCLERTLDAGREAGCRLRVCSPGGARLAPDATSDRQAETGFGRRLMGAIRRAGADSSGPLIVVGTDTPGLDGAILRRAVEALGADPEEVVIGPASDGGIYLLASARPLLAELAAVRWRGDRTLDSLVAALRAAGRPVRLLATMGDLDSRGDLERWIARERAASGAWAGLVAALRAALRLLAQPPLKPRAPLSLPAWNRVAVGRAPPR